MNKMLSCSLKIVVVVTRSAVAIVGSPVREGSILDQLSFTGPGLAVALRRDITSISRKNE